jgi:hypothetical protein
MNCKNCTNKIQGNYCAHCGHAGKLTRIDGQFILHEIEHVLHFEKGLLFTIKELMVRPGKSVREYISGDRSRLVKPIIFIIVTSLMYTLMAHLFQIEKNSFTISEDKALTSNAIADWIRNHYGYANIIMGFFIACWLKIFFRKHDVNFFEISMLLAYVMGIGMLFLAAVVVLNGIAGFNLGSAFIYVVFVYVSWAIGQFFDQKKPTSFIKAGAAYALGFFTFKASAWALGFGYNAIMKYVN